MTVPLRRSKQARAAPVLTLALTLGASLSGCRSTSTKQFAAMPGPIAKPAAVPGDPTESAAVHRRSRADENTRHPVPIATLRTPSQAGAPSSPPSSQPPPHRSAPPASQPPADPQPAPAVPPTYHVVRPGETAYRIAKNFGVTVEALADANRLTDPTRLRTGQRLEIPIEAAGHVGDRWVRSEESPAPTKTTEVGVLQRWNWPVAGTIGSPFGAGRRRHLHTGIDILAPPGSEIRAVHAGRVSFSGRRGDYGLLLVIDHEDGYCTFYSHNRRNLVRQGDRVAAGDLIALSGQTGNATGPHLHFEIRKDDIPMDPLSFLNPSD